MTGGSRTALAIALQQRPMPTKGLLCQQDDATQTEAFRRAYSRMNLHTAAGGLGVRKWETYCDAAYVGCWAQSWQVSQLKLGGTIVSVLPSLAKVIEEAHLLREATAHGWAHHLTAILPGLAARGRERYKVAAYREGIVCVYEELCLYSMVIFSPLTK